MAAVSSRLAYVKAKAYESEAEELVKNGQFEEAKTAYNNAKDAMKKAGADNYAGDISDLEGKIESVAQKVSDEKTDKLNEETRTLVSQAANKFNEGKYDDAQEICNEVSEKLAQNNIASGIVYEDLQKLLECISDAKSGERYEEEAKEYEKKGDYEMAYSTYEYAQKSYEKAGVSDKEREMRRKLNEVEKIIKQEQEEE